jgi:hypothetical protein
MDRRSFLAALAACPAIGGSRAMAAAELRSAARDAWLFGLPLIEMAQTRARAFANGARPNQLRHVRNLATHQSRGVTAPNNDTLYSSAWLDLTQGPVSVTLPKTGRRYFSLALMDMYTNNFAVLGTRTTGENGQAFDVVGPTASADVAAIRSPTPWVWLLGRTLVDGEADLKAAHAVQDQIGLSGPERPQLSGPVTQRSAPWASYLGSVQALMNENPPRATDARLLGAIAPLGLGPGATFDASRFSSTEGADIEAGVRDAQEMLRTRGQGRAVQGWNYPRSNLGDFGQDYLFRAQVALVGLAALPPAEAMYMRAVDASGGGALDSSRTWRLSFAANALPPVDGFWSISMYEITEAGQLFFFDNPINRYSIGDRTPGLKRGADGSLDIWMSQQDPGGERSANWLPTPKGRPFTVSFRAYLPRPTMIEGSFLLPPLQAV